MLGRTRKVRAAGGGKIGSKNSPWKDFEGGKSKPYAVAAVAAVNARVLMPAVHVARTQGEKSRIIWYHRWRLLEGALMFPCALSMPRRDPLACLPGPGLRQACRAAILTKAAVQAGFIPTEMKRCRSRNRGLHGRTTPNHPCFRKLRAAALPLFT